MFQNSFTGFDAAFIDYFTNLRFTVTQECEADLLALKIMNEVGFSLTSLEYKSLLKLLS
jgi:predicted Zn-dependent protease